MNGVLRAFATALGVPLLLVLAVLLNLLVVTYSVDLVLAGWLLFLLFFDPILETVILWASVAAYAPLAAAMSVEATLKQRAAGIVAVPAGLGVGFLLWQLQNWIVYGVIGADPRFYNWLFGRVGLAI